MSLPQIPTSRKAEYLVYLAFSGSVALFVATLDMLPAGLRSLVDANLALFTTVTSTGLGGFLFALRMDRAVDRILLRYVRSAARKKEIIQFMAQTIVFLRFWEVAPTRIPPLQEQMKDAAKSTIEGEDLHEDVWTQKGIFFLMLSLLMVGLAILFSDTAALSLEVRAVGTGVAFGFPPTLGLVWWRRYRRFPDRCVDVLEFWFFYDQLQTERMMRPAETKHGSKDDAGTPSWMLGGHKDVRWNADESSVHKDTLVKHCDEIAKVLVRKEWIRFEQHLASVKDMLKKASFRFIKDEALDFMILAWSETLALPEGMRTEKADARLDSLRTALLPLSRQDLRLREVCAKSRLSTVGIGRLLSLVDPERLNPTLYNRLGLSIGGALRSATGEAVKEVSTALSGWLKGEPKKVLSALKVMESIDPLIFDALLECPPLSTDRESARHVLSAAEDVPYRDSRLALHLLARLPKDEASLEEVVEYSSAAATTGGDDVQLWAIDALGEMGVEVPERRSVYDAFSLTLSRKQDDHTLAAAFAVLHMGERGPVVEGLASMLTGILPLRNHYIQQKIYDLSRESRESDESIPSLLFRVGWTKCGGRVIDQQSLSETRGSEVGDRFVFLPPEKDAADSKERSDEYYLTRESQDVTYLVGRAAASDDNIAMMALRRIREEFSNSLSNMETIRKLIEAMIATSQDCRRIVIAALIAMHAATLPVEHHLELARELLKASKDVTEPSIRYMLAYAIGSLGREVQFELARQIRNDDYTAVSALSMYHLGKKLHPYGDVVRGIAEGLDKNSSEPRTACMLALTALGASARRFGSLLDKMTAVLESASGADKACALECLMSVGGPRVHASLKSATKGLDHWWLRSLYRQALQATASHPN